MTRPAGSVSAPSLISLRDDPNLRFPKWPKLIDDLRIFEMPDGLGLLLHFGDVPVVLRGQMAQRSFAFLRERLDGTRNIDDVASALPADLAVATVARTLRLLHTKGLLVDGGFDDTPLTWRAPEPVLGRQLLFWGRHVGLTRAAESGHAVQSRLGHASVVVVGTGLFGSTTADLLSRSGCGQLKWMGWDELDDGPEEAGGECVANLRTSPIPPDAWASAGPATLDEAEEILRDWLFDADLVVTATRNAPDALFEAINRLSRQVKKPWLRGNLEASAIELGPYVQPGSSACFQCVRLRRRSADPLAIEHELDHASRMASNTGGLAPIGESLFGATLGASHLVGEVIRILTGIAPAYLLNRVVTISPVTGENREHEVLRVPRCPGCSSGTVSLGERTGA